MQYRRFGRTGWNVSEIGYGMWGMAGWTGSEDAESLASLQRAVDLGCSFFDTAWAYGDGRSEQLLGKILKSPMAGAARVHAGRLLSAGVHRRIRRQKPGEFGREDTGPDSASYLGR